MLGCGLELVGCGSECPDRDQLSVMTIAHVDALLTVKEGSGWRSRWVLRFVGCYLAYFIYVVLYVPDDMHTLPQVVGCGSGCRDCGPPAA